MSFTLFASVLWCPTRIIVCCVFRRLVYPLLQVYRDCQFILLHLQHSKIDNPERLSTLDTQNTRRKQKKQKNRTQCMSYTYNQLEIKPSHCFDGVRVANLFSFSLRVCTLFVFAWHLVSNVKPLSELSSVYLPLFLSCPPDEK